MDRILHGDNLPLLRAEPDASVTLAYLDPPFNTGRRQARRTLATVADPGGDRTGFGGRRYASRLLETSSYRDAFDDYLGFLAPRLARGPPPARARTARSTSTSTTARRTTASCCSTSCSAARASSTS